MRIATGKVVQGKLELDGDSLGEGVTVTVLVPESDETFELTPDEEAALEEPGTPEEEKPVAKATVLEEESGGARVEGDPTRAWKLPEGEVVTSIAGASMGAVPAPAPAPAPARPARVDGLVVQVSDPEPAPVEAQMAPAAAVETTAPPKRSAPC